ncbi:MAG: beta-propeller fold lactonase family protein [Verrucomicrobiota bacterium]
MKTYKLLTMIAAVCLAASGIAAADQSLYLAAGDKITVFNIDPESGKLDLLQEISLPGAGPMTVSPEKSFLYITANQSPNPNSKKKSPALATFKVKADSTLEHLKTAPANLAPGYLKTDATGTFLAGNHYGPGKVTVWKLDDQVYQGETIQEIDLEPKAHSAVFAPSNTSLLIPATGPNKVFQLTFDPATGEVTPNNPPYADGPQADGEARQPRHLIFHPELDIVYTTNEREHPGVGVWSWDPDTQSLRTIQNIVTKPRDFDGITTTADLHLTPNNKFLYVSNRDVTDRQATSGINSIVAFSVNSATGELTLIDHYPCEHVPRSFAIDESGSFLYVAGQGDNTLGAYRIDPETGALGKIEQHKTGNRPSWVHIMSPPSVP